MAAANSLWNNRRDLGDLTDEGVVRIENQKKKRSEIRNFRIEPQSSMRTSQSSMTESSKRPKSTLEVRLSSWYQMYSKSGAGVVVTGTLARSSQYTCTDTEETQ